MSKVQERLTAAGIILPEPVAPVANYVPFVRAGTLVHISGQVSLDASGGIKGVVGENVDLDTAIRAAELCGINTTMLVSCLRPVITFLLASLKLWKPRVLVQSKVKSQLALE